MKTRMVLPDTLYGFSIGELENILNRVKSISGAKITNKEWTYDLIKKYRIKNIRDRWLLIAPSNKRLKIALGEIRKAIRDRDGFKKFNFKRI